MTKLTLTRLDDPIVAQLGEQVTSRYVETFLLPILGPTAVWLLRCASYRTEQGPFVVDAKELGSLLGVGGVGPHSSLMKTLVRLVDFEMARRVGDDTWALRAHVAHLPQRWLNRLPETLRQAHGLYLVHNDEDRAAAYEARVA